MVRTAHKRYFLAVLLCTCNGSNIVMPVPTYVASADEDPSTAPGSRRGANATPRSGAAGTSQPNGAVAPAPTNRPNSTSVPATGSTSTGATTAAAPRGQPRGAGTTPQTQPPVKKTTPSRTPPRRRVRKKKPPVTPPVLEHQPGADWYCYETIYNGRQPPARISCFILPYLCERDRLSNMGPGRETFDCRIWSHPVYCVRIREIYTETETTICAHTAEHCELRGQELAKTGEWSIVKKCEKRV